MSSWCFPLHHSNKDGQQKQIFLIPPRTSTHSLISSCWSPQIGSFQGNNSLKGNLLLQFCFSLCSLCLSLHLSLPAGLIWSPGKCPTVMSWCDLCHGLWSRLISPNSPSSNLLHLLSRPSEAPLPESQPAWLLQRGEMLVQGSMTQLMCERRIPFQAFTCLEKETRRVHPSSSSVFLSLMCF